MGGSKQSEGCVEAYFVAGHILSPATRKYAATVVCVSARGERERQTETDRQTDRQVSSLHLRRRH